MRFYESKGGDDVKIRDLPKCTISNNNHSLDYADLSLD